MGFPSLSGDAVFGALVTAALTGRPAPGRHAPGQQEQSVLPVAGSSVLFAATDGSIAVRVRSGGAPAVINDGYARYDIVERDGRKSIPDFAGIQLYSQAVPILFDGWRGPTDRQSVEGDIRLLERLAVVPDGATRPPLVRAIGNVRRPDLTYVINGIAWADGGSDEVIADAITGDRYRQAATVTLLEFEADELLSVGTHDSQGRLVHTTRVRAREHSFRDVAKRVYGTRNRARDLAKANDLPLSTRLVEHQLLTLPAT